MVSIIILNYNRKKEVLYTLEKTIANFGHKDDYEIIVIDQNSNDGSQEAIKEQYSNVKLYSSSVNLGVAGGRNKGAELAKGDIYVFLDDDSHFKTANALSMITSLFKDKDLGIVGFKILDTSDNIRDWVYNNSSNKFSNQAFYSQQFVGCGHAIRADLFNTVKGYSEDLFFWGEEIEFCLKTYRDSSYKIIYHPSIEVIHRVSQLSRYHFKSDRTVFKTRNRFALLNNYFPKTSFFYYFFYTYFFIGYFIRSIQNSAFKYFIKGFRDSSKIHITEKKLSHKDVFNYSKCTFKLSFNLPKHYYQNNFDN